MQKTKIKTATFASVTLFLLITIASVGFCAETFDGTRIEYPVPGWKFDGPSPWFSASNSMDQTYNLSACSFNAYSSGPSSPHILWKHRIMSGGATGGGSGAKDWGFVPDGQFLMYGQGPIVCGGKFAYTTTNLNDAPETGGSWLVCGDVETGETLWRTELPSYMGWINWYNHVAQYSGGLSIMIITGSWVRIYDSENGGVILEWNYGATTGGLGQPGIIMEENVLYRRMSSVCYGWVFGVRGNQREGQVEMWNINNFGTPTLEWGPTDGNNVNFIYGDYMLAWYPHTGIATGIHRWTGELLWQRSEQGFCRGPAGYGNWYHFAADGYVYAIDLATGTTVWQSAEPAGTGYWTEHGATVGNDVLINGNYDGGVYCYDAHTGELKWVHFQGPTPWEPFFSWYGTNCYGSAPPAMSGDGKCYIMPGDHMTHQPDVPEMYMECFDVETGEVLWRFPAHEMSHTHRIAIADGMVFMPDIYTNQLFCFGKGPTVTDVAVDSTRITKGEYVWITGQVTDDSPGQKGTPAVSRESMEAWMQFLHHQKPAPVAKTGVPVTIYAEDSAGVVTEVGTVTSDGDTGLYKFKWVPPKEDIYELTAVFFGDDSYWDSHGLTTLTVAGTSVSTTSLAAATGSIALIAAICIVLGKEIRKRKVKTE
jgi:outer membrane protein assembly factor BamB